MEKNTKKYSRCNRTLKSNQEFKKPHLLHGIAEVKPYICEECSEESTEMQSATFNSDHRPESHLETPIEVKPCVCEVCFEAFYSEEQFKCHLETHSKVSPGASSGAFDLEEQPTCQVVTQSDTKSLISNLFPVTPPSTQPHESHLVTDSTNKPFTCKLCNIGFQLESTLIKHQRMHTGEKPYSCQKCLQAFTTEEHLHCHMSKQHALQYVRKTKHTCDVCDKKYSKKIDLLKHCLTHHTCDVCKKGFINEDTLEKHIETHIKKPLTCEVCKKTFDHI